MRAELVEACQQMRAELVEACERVPFDRLRAHTRQAQGT
jgi:hypothetical protein